MEFDESKVYTPINADKVKIGSKGYYADDLKTLKERVNSHSRRWRGEVDKIYDTDSTYRFAIKSNTKFALFYLVEEPEEKKYRPYLNTTEIPNGALLNIVVSGDNTRLLITAVEDKRVYLGPHGWVDLYDLYKYYTWLNGTPCGKEEQGTNEND